MKNKLLAAAGAATLALTMSATASFAGYMQPGETMGVSLISPLPEGVFFADLEDYGGQGNTPVHIGVNIPVLIWSTPWTFANSRLEMIAAVPFAHIDGGGLDRVGAITYALGPMLAHDFGGGLTGGIAGLIRTPDPSQNLAAISGRRTVEADFRQSAQYVSPTGILGGLTFIENAAFTTGFGASGLVAGQNDMFAGDFTIEKTFDKLTIGFTGFGNIRHEHDRFAPRNKNVEARWLDRLRLREVHADRHRDARHHQQRQLDGSGRERRRDPRLDPPDRSAVCRSGAGRRSSPATDPIGFGRSHEIVRSRRLPAIRQAIFVRAAYGRTDVDSEWLREA